MTSVLNDRSICRGTVSRRVWHSLRLTVGRAGTFWSRIVRRLKRHGRVLDVVVIQKTPQPEAKTGGVAVGSHRQKS